MKVLIIEDELAATKRLKKLLLELNEGIEVVDQLDSIESSVNWLMEPPPIDLIFMDLHLADGPCFEIFNYVTLNKPILFTKAYDQYAIQAFKVNAIDYLLKPIKKADLQKALQKWSRLNYNGKEEFQKLLNILQHDKSPKRFLTRVGQKIRLIRYWMNWRLCSIQNCSSASTGNSSLM